MDEMYEWDWSQVVTGSESRYRNAWAKAVTFQTRYGVREAGPNRWEVPGAGRDEEEVIYYEVRLAPWGLTCNCDAGHFATPCYHSAGVAQRLGMRYGTIGA